MYQRYSKVSGLRRQTFYEDANKYYLGTPLLSIKDDPVLF
jgi:hypothetical protein